MAGFVKQPLRVFYVTESLVIEVKHICSCGCLPEPSGYLTQEFNGRTHTTSADNTFMLFDYKFSNSRDERIKPTIYGKEVFLIQETYKNYFITVIEVTFNDKKVRQKFTISASSYKDSFNQMLEKLKN